MLSYLESDQRASKFAAFDDLGDATFVDIQADGSSGAAGKSVSTDKLVVTSNGQAFFLRSPDGTWVNQVFDVQVEFFANTVARATRILSFSVDDDGRITRGAGSSSGQVGTTVVEAGVGTQSYTGTVYIPESGRGVTFHLLSILSVPTPGEFTPLWNVYSDFSGSGPTGRIRYRNYGSWVVLSTDIAAGGTFASRSKTKQFRWGPGSLPAAIRPPADRLVPCMVSRNGVTVAGQAQFNVDGSAEFWPLIAGLSSQLVRGTFAAAGSNTKGLPDEWQVVYCKPIVRFRVTEAGDQRITEDENLRRL